MGRPLPLFFAGAAAFIAAPAFAAPRIDPSFVAAEPPANLGEAVRSLEAHSIALDEVVVAKDFPCSEPALRAALKKSLRAYGLDATPGKEARYVLAVSAFGFKLIARPQAKRTTALADIGYRLTDRATGQSQFEQPLETGYTARAPRKSRLHDERLALAQSRSRAEFAAMANAAAMAPAPAADFESARCAPANARGGVGDGELDDAARQRCAANHAVRLNLQSFFLRIAFAGGSGASQASPSAER